MIDEKFQKTAIKNEVVNQDIVKKSKRSFMDRLPRSVNLFYSGMKSYLDKIQGYKRLKKEFLNKMHYELNLEAPRSFNEKIQWKKLNDRNPDIPVTADKLAVRSYIRRVLGDEAADRILIPLYYADENPEDIPFEQLPDKFVLKPNHGSQMHLIVEDKNVIEPARIIEECKKWLRVNYGFYNYEWAYRNIRRKIIVEKLLKTESGELPLDYKFFCFHGKCRLIRAQINRFDKEVLTGYYTTGWELLPVYRPGYNIITKDVERPYNLDEMISITESISKEFDAVRIDLYNCDGHVYFGEVTHYDFCGLARFEPEEFDFQLGGYWALEKDYWRRKDA